MSGVWFEAEHGPPPPSDDAPLVARAQWALGHLNRFYAGEPCSRRGLARMVAWMGETVARLASELADTPTGTAMILSVYVGQIRRTSHKDGGSCCLVERINITSKDERGSRSFWVRASHESGAPVFGAESAVVSASLIRKYYPYVVGLVPKELCEQRQKEDDSQ